MNPALRLFSALLLLLAFAARVQADDETRGYGVAAGTVIVPAGLSPKEIQRGIMEAGAEEDFIVKARDDEKVVLYREDGRWTVALTFTYTTEEIQIYSKSVRSGEAKLPERWIKKLKKQISQRLNTAAILK